MSDTELPAVVWVDGVPYGASAGNVFPSVAYAHQVIEENPAAFVGKVATAVAIQPHGLTAVEGETDDSAGRSGIPGHFDVIGSGSPDGTLRDPDQRSLMAVLTDGTNLYGTSEDALQPAFGELAGATATITANNAAHLTAVEIRPFDELLTA